MRGMRLPLLLFIIPIVVGVLYWFFQGMGTPSVTDAAGFVMLAALGAAMGLGFFVILRGAEDL